MKVAALSSATLLGASTAEAGGYEAPEGSARTLGRGNAGAVADTGADVLIWNPAAIAAAPREISVGVFDRMTSRELRDRGSAISRAGQPAQPVGGLASISDPSPDFVVPSFAVSMPVGERLAAGFAVSHPYHLKTRFPTNAFNRYDTLKSRIDVTQVRGALAWRATDTISVGVAVDGQQMKAALDAAFPNLSPLLPDAVSSLAADGWDLGWSAGVQGRLGRAQLGFAYASSVGHELDGTLAVQGLLAPLDAANFTAPAQVRVTTPWTATLGASWPATPRLTLAAQVKRTGWSEYQEIGLSFAGQQQAIAQDYRDTTSLAVGADYALSDRWTVRAGLAWDPTPTPDHIREAGVPDTDRITYAAGATASLAQGVKLDLALAYAALHGDRLSRDIPFYEGTPAASLATLRGDVDGHDLSLGAALRWDF